MTKLINHLISKFIFKLNNSKLTPRDMNVALKCDQLMDK